MCNARTPARYTLIDCGFKRSAKKATNKESVSSDEGTAVKPCLSQNVRYWRCAELYVRWVFSANPLWK